MFHVVIPARYGASRLPGKPLLPIAGKPLIQWVWESARASGAASVTVATDDERIRSAAAGFGAECVMTGDHASGTDRMAEVVRRRGFDADEVVVNLQGDEPLMPSSVIAEVAAALGPGIDIATAVAPIETLAEFWDTSCVKALRARDGRALYFSRAPVPWPRDHVSDHRPTVFAGAWRHIGIYAYRVRSLLEFSAWPPSSLEMTEKLEQLRALEHGMTIHLIALGEAPPAGVDTPDDLARVRAHLARLGPRN
ncbi:MAG: 3-deoxy-manno-octulosonate cytidylyltransferase synthetase [Gammaproteobacteria bacterium]|jgi:3-deoxy-manno-octulosonate cytidylyltransferase (CMP-KDO synthetase)|nr:3-deoxy-manno-octulosonate cytidylyltransferase synthetase [Gammaproteobacteria bacterium]